VTPAATTRLVLSWMKNSTYNVCNQLVSTVNKSHATIPSAWLAGTAPSSVQSVAAPGRGRGVAAAS
jgi:hypothetical protein